MIERIRYRGWENCWKLSNGEAELIVLADVGPRVIWYSLRGEENQLHEVEQDAGKTRGSDFRLYGGHRLWAAPEIERTYFPDNVAVQVEQIEAEQANQVLRLTAPVETSPVPDHAKMRALICAVDGSDNNIALMQFADCLCKSLGATLRLVHVIPGMETWVPEQIDRQLEEDLRLDARKKIEDLQKKAGVEAPLCVTVGAIADGVREEARRPCERTVLELGEVDPAEDADGEGDERGEPDGAFDRRGRTGQHSSPFALV